MSTLFLERNFLEQKIRRVTRLAAHKHESHRTSSVSTTDLPHRALKDAACARLDRRGLLNLFFAEPSMGIAHLSKYFTIHVVKLPRPKETLPRVV